MDEETIQWQEWVIRSLEELRTVSLFSGVIHWEEFFIGLARAMEQQGSYSRLAHLTGVNRQVLYRWVGGTATPSLEMILRFCYVCGVMPAQVLAGQTALLKQVIQSGTASHPPRHRRIPYQRVDKQRCLELLQNILDDGEDFPSLPQVAKRLGYSDQVLMHHFPQECAKIVQRAQEHRRQQKEQRIARLCEEVRQAVITLHAQGISPTHRRVMRLLSRPSFMRAPEASAVWHATRRELGLEA